MIQNVGADVSEKHFRTKSVSALHPILPVYFNILSPGIGTYSNFEIVIIIFELKKILVGWLVHFGLNDPLRQYFSLYRVVSQRGGERGEKG